jgi:hypothetical protein
MDTRNILGLEGRPLWSRLNYTLANPIEEPILKNTVQILSIDIKMYLESGPSRRSILVTSYPIIFSMTASAEETHPVCNNLLATIP